VLLTDYVMPGMNGVDLALAAHAAFPSLHCLIMSGQPPVETAPVFAWLGKPLDLDALLAAIASA
jgi:DNA-binding NtrC family response regulator